MKSWPTAPHWTCLLYTSLTANLAVPALSADTQQDTASPSPSPAFRDISGHWAEASISRWSGYGVVQGDQNGNFNPDQPITRGSMATVMVNLLGLSEKPAENPYADLTGSEWYADAVLKCTAAGVMQGDGSNCNANANITRQEATVMFARALGVEEDASPNLSKFSDGGDVAGWAAGAVSAMADRGIITGAGDGRVLPNHNIDRASTMALLDKAISTYADKAGSYEATEDGITLAKAGDVTISGSADTILLAAGDVYKRQMHPVCADSISDKKSIGARGGRQCFFMFSAADRDRPAVFILSVRLQGDKVGLLFKHGHLALLRGQRDPRLDADIGRVGPRHVPQSQIGHLRAGYGNAAAVSLRFQRHLSVRLREHDGVVIKQVVAQGQEPPLFQREGLVPSAAEAVRRKAHPHRAARMRETKAVVGEMLPLPQRNPETRMAAQAEIHSLLVPVFHGIGNLQLLSLQGVAHPEGKTAGIADAGIGAVGELEGHTAVRLLRQLKAAIGRKRCV